MPNKKLPSKKNPQSNKSIFSQFRKYGSLIGGFIVLIGGIFITLRSRGILQTMDVPNSNVLPTFNDPNICSSSNAISWMTFKPGQIAIPSETPNHALTYPCQDYTGLDIRVNNKDDAILSYYQMGYKLNANQRNYQVAIMWLKEQPKILDMFPKQALELIKKLNGKIKNTTEGYREQNIALLQEEGKGFFHDPNNPDPIWSDGSIDNTLQPPEKKLLVSIRKKVNNLIDKFNIEGPNTKIALLQESVLLALITDQFQVEMNELYKAEGLKVPQINEIEKLTATEKIFIEKYYIVKPRFNLQHSEEAFTKNIDNILIIGKTNPEKAAAFFHMWIVDEHLFNDGNGRTARAIMNDILESQGLPLVVFPSRIAYKNAIQEAIKQNKYEIFYEYYLSIKKERLVEQTKETCQTLVEKQCDKLQNFKKCLLQLFNNYKSKLEIGQSDRESNIQNAKKPNPS